MIELSSLDRRDQYNISRNVEDFFIVAKKSHHFYSIFNKFKHLVPENLHHSFWVIITGSSKAIRYGNTKFHLPLGWESYKNANKITKQNHRVGNIKKVIGILESHSLITLYKGFHKSEEYSMLSFVDMSTHWISEFSIPVCERFGMGRELDCVEIIHTDFSRNSRGRKVKKKSSLPTTGVYGINLIKRSLLVYNKVLSNTNIEICNQEVKNLIYKRVFEDNLRSHGRWYTFGDFQSHTKEERKTIKLNGLDTVEIDLIACQPSTLYSWNGIKKPDNFDPYTIEVEGNYNKKELRSLCKVGLLCIMFNDSRRAASSALREHLDNDKNKEDKNTRQYTSLYNTHKLITQVVDSLIYVNKEISNHFFTEGLWKRLQYVDSSICKIVVDHFSNKGIPVISVHDSWVIASQYKEELITVMKSAWCVVVKDGGLNFGYTVEV